VEPAAIIDIVIVILCILGIVFGYRRKWWLLLVICAAVLLWELIAFIL